MIRKHDKYTNAPGYYGQNGFVYSTSGARPVKTPRTGSIFGWVVILLPVAAILIHYFGG